MPAISFTLAQALNVPSNTTDAYTIGVALLGQLNLKTPPGGPIGSLAPVAGGDVYQDFVPQLVTKLETVLAAGRTPAGSAVADIAAQVVAPFDLRQLVAIKREVGWANEATTEMLVPDRTGHVRAHVAQLLTPAVTALLANWQNRGLLTAA